MAWLEEAVSPATAIWLRATTAIGGAVAAARLQTLPVTAATMVAAIATWSWAIDGCDRW